MTETFFISQNERNGKPAIRRVLFVDDDQQVLEALKTTLLGMRAGWEMTFTTSGKDALRKFDETEFDVIVTDLHMPDMNGFELLTEVLRRHPETVRIVLSATVKQDLGIRSSNTAHQYLAKPCDAATLRTSLNTAGRIRELLLSPTLRSLISRMTSLPSLPSVHSKLVESLANPETSSRELGDIIAQDVGMTTKVLQIANSAYFGLYRYIASPAEAAVYLGVDTIRALSMSTGVFSSFQHTGLPPVFIGQLQQHSMTTGMVAQAIATSEGLPKKTSDICLVGGFLHDVGKLILAASSPKEYADVLSASGHDGASFFESERRVFGATHADIGAYLLWLWGLPDAICNAVAFHHKPADCSAKTFTAAGAIHVADELERDRSFAASSGRRAEMDMAYVTALGLADRIPEWRSLCDRYGERAEG